MDTHALVYVMLSSPWIHAQRSYLNPLRGQKTLFAVAPGMNTRILLANSWWVCRAILRSLKQTNASVRNFLRAFFHMWALLKKLSNFERTCQVLEWFVTSAHLAHMNPRHLQKRLVSNYQVDFGSVGAWYLSGFPHAVTGSAWIGSPTKWIHQ